MRSIQTHLPDPVPAGIDKKTYFTNNYQKLGTDPMAYGWYQLQMVLIVCDEPARSFQQVLDGLPENRTNDYVFQNELRTHQLMTALSK